MAEKQLTTYYLTELLLTILHEAATFGFEPAGLASEQANLDQVIANVGEEPSSPR